MRHNITFYKTETTFRPEHEYLVNNMLHVLDDQCPRRHSFQSLLPERFLESISPLPERQDSLFPESHELHIHQLDTIGLLDIKNYDSNTLLRYLNDIGSAEWDIGSTRNLISQFGTEAFGLYLPFHYYFNCGWGIYLFPEIISHNAHYLFDIFKSDGYTANEMLIMYFFAVYRHELYHYQTERYATKLELTTNKAHYLALSDIDSKVHHTPAWLSEALAEATVLNSLLVTKRSGMKSEKMRKVYTYDLQNMPPGYRDYGCKNFGGPDQAQLYFASQIKEMNVKPGSKLPDFFTVKGEFSSNDLDVPVYFVTGFNNIKRVR